MTKQDIFKEERKISFICKCGNKVIHGGGICKECLLKRDDIFKEADLSSRILELVDCQVNEAQGNGERLTQSDLQGAISAVIVDAIRYGRTNK